MEYVCTRSGLAEDNQLNGNTSHTIILPWFRESGNALHFDYVLKPGVAVTTNTSCSLLGIDLDDGFSADPDPQRCGRQSIEYPWHIFVTYVSRLSGGGKRYQWGLRRWGPPLW